MRDKLEKAVACYEATGERPRAWVQTVKRGGQIMNILDIDDTNSWLAPLETFIDPEGFGYESFDSLNYYTNKLILLNNKVIDMPYSFIPSVLILYALHDRWKNYKRRCMRMLKHLIKYLNER